MGASQEAQFHVSSTRASKTRSTLRSHPTICLSLCCGLPFLPVLVVHAQAFSSLACFCRMSAQLAARLTPAMQQMLRSQSLDESCRAAAVLSWGDVVLTLPSNEREAMVDCFASLLQVGAVSCEGDIAGNRMGSPVQAHRHRHRH